MFAKIMHPNSLFANDHLVTYSTTYMRDKKKKKILIESTSCLFFERGNNDILIRVQSTIVFICNHYIKALVKEIYIQHHTARAMPS